MATTIDDRRPADTVPDSGHPDPSAVTFTRRLIRSLRANWPVLALAAAAMAISFLARWFIYPAYSYNRDEPVYLWMVEHLRAGQLTAEDGGAPQFFHPWLGASREGLFFSHFTVGWPAVLLLSELVFGIPGVAPALGAALIVVGTVALAREVTGDRSLALVAGGVMAASPILAVQGGVYLGYLFSAGLGLMFAAAAVSGVRQRKPWLLLVAGALLGWIFLTRPFDAVVWGGAVTTYLAIIHRREWRTLVRAAAWIAPAALPFVVMGLIFNAKVTGSALELPNAAADPLDKFGFGLRRMMPGFNGARYDLERAVGSTLRNGFRLPLFLAGGYVGLAAAGVGLWLRRRDRTSLLLLALILAFPATYFLHWGTWVSSLVSRWGGPIYFVPLYGPLAILIATTIVAGWRYRRALGIGLVVILAVATLPAAVSRLGANRRISEAQEPWRSSVASIDGPALIFVERSSAYLQFYNPFSANGPDLDDRLLYATDQGAENIDLIARMGDRTPYLQRAVLDDADMSVPSDNPARFPPGELQPREHPPTPTIVLTRLRLVEGSIVQLHLRVRNPRRTDAVRAFIDLGDGSGPLWRTLSDDGSASETFDVTWTVGTATRPSPGGEPVLPLLGRRGTIALGAAYGSTPSTADTPTVRTLLHYRVSGSDVQVLFPGDPQRLKKITGHRLAWYQDRWSVVQDRSHPPVLDVDAEPRL